MKVSSRVLADVARGFRVKVMTIPFVAAAPTVMAWEGREFDPTLGTRYVREALLPGTRRLGSIPAPGGRLRQRGLYQLDVYSPAGVGIDAVRLDAEAIRTVFPPGSWFVENNQTITVDSADIAATRYEPEWIILSVTMAWYADTTNAG